MTFLALVIDTSDLREGVPVRIFNQSNGSIFYVDMPLMQEDLDAIKVDGRINTVK